MRGCAVEVLMLIGLVVINGLFAMSEIALVTARKARLMKLAADGDRAAAVALKLGEDPTKFLSTIQIGITSIGLLNGIVGEAILAEPLARWLLSMGLPEASAHLAATAVVVVAVTYVSIVVGELAPKRLGQINPELIARLAARPMQLLAMCTRPFVMLLTFSTHTLLRLLGVRQHTPNGVTEEEIHAMLEEGSETGVIEQHQHEMVRNVFRLDERHIGSMMIPRSDIAWLDIELPLADNLAIIAEHGYSRYPVCRGGLDDVVGVMTAQQLLHQLTQHQANSLAEGLLPAVFVPETLSGMELLEHFRGSDTQMVFVVDEYGEVQGVITLRDVLEAITGEFTPTEAGDAWAIQREDGSWLVDGLIPIPELKDRLEIKSLPDEDRGRYNTLAGMVMLLLGRLPQTTDTVEWDGWRFEVVDMDGKRIDKILASHFQED